MPVINKSYFAILGLLSIKPMSAYELVKFSKESIGLFWNESYGHTHKSLKELEQKEAIMLVESNDKGRKQKIFDITVSGKKMLKEWLKEKPEQVVFRNELMLKVFLSDEKNLKELEEFIIDQQKEAQEIANILEAIENSLKESTGNKVQRQLWLLTLDYGHKYMNMNIEWCKNALNEIENLRK